MGFTGVVSPPVSGGAVTLLITGFPGPRCRVKTEDVLKYLMQVRRFLLDGYAVC